MFLFYLLLILVDSVQLGGTTSQENKKIAIQIDASTIYVSRKSGQTKFNVKLKNISRAQINVAGFFYDQDIDMPYRPNILVILYDSSGAGMRAWGQGTLLDSTMVQEILRGDEEKIQERLRKLEQEENDHLSKYRTKMIQSVRTLMPGDSLVTEIRVNLFKEYELTVGTYWLSVWYRVDQRVLRWIPPERIPLLIEIKSEKRRVIVTDVSRE
jgi:hypothetical protein